MRRARRMALVLFTLYACAPEARAAPNPSEASARPAVWSVDFDDSILADLLRQVDQGCCDLAMAEARVRRARAEVDLARAPRGLHLDIGGEGVVGGDTFHTARSGVGVPAAATYELDLSGRMVRGVKAAEADRTATQDERAQARLEVSRELVRAYLDLGALIAQRSLLDDRLAIAAEDRRLLQIRAGLGRVSPGDLATASAHQSELADQRRAADRTISLRLATIGDLTGRHAPAPPAGTGPSPVLPPVPTVVSSERVLERPDVRAAASRLAAANARRAEAVAATRPRFALIAGLGSSDPNLLYLLDVRALAWSIAGGLSHSLLDGGAGKARIRVANADADLADLAYRKAVASAWTEVATDMARLDAAQATRVRMDGALAATRDAERIGRFRHAAGRIDGRAMAALKDAVAASRSELAVATAQEAQAYADLAMALGGHVE